MAAFERILVTGGAGFVGGHLCAALAEAYPQATRSLLLRPGERGGHEAFAAA
ncbi:MAG: NAD-dependent, partial [Methylocystaceae bacterium]